jgi:polysaccharide pyruvyl transferase WcaK-like protein
VQIISRKFSKLARLGKTEIVNLFPKIQDVHHLYSVTDEEISIELVLKAQGNIYVTQFGYEYFNRFLSLHSNQSFVSNIVIEIINIEGNLDLCLNLIRNLITSQINSPIRILLKPNLKSTELFENWITTIGPLFEQIESANSKLITSTFIVLPTNYLFVDDLKMWVLKSKFRRIDYYPGLNYFYPSTPENSSENFHVKMFFDALTRDKSINFHWRNFYRNFALGKILRANSFYLKYNDIRGLLVPTEISKLSHENSLSLELPKLNRKFGDNPALGLQTLAELLKTMLRNKFFGRGKQTTWNHKPIEDKLARSSQGVNVKDWRTVLITGWYGTETQGDKAIIGEVLHFIKSASPKCKVILTTLHAAISEQTNLELEDLYGVELIKLEYGRLSSIISQTDAVIVGGGPLMESVSMKDIGAIFVEAYKQNKPRIIFGCGIGPIHSPEVERITRYLLSVCNAGFVRDKESIDFASKLFPDHKLKFACDPAVGFVSRWRKENGVVYTPKEIASIATLLRANTSEFSPESNHEKLRTANELLAKKVARALDEIATQTGADLELLHMNAPWVGGDDRIYNRILSSQLATSTKFNLVREYLTLKQHMKFLSKCNSALAMRYHGHIFCMAMGIPFLSLDYTGKSGKVSSLVNRIGYSQWSIKWDEIDPNTMTETYEKLMIDSAKWSNHLISEADKLVTLLNQTYQEVFNYCPENTYYE